MTAPVRVQRKRSKGFRLQDASPNGLPVVYVGRPTKWGNPFQVVGITREEARARFALHMQTYFSWRVCTPSGMKEWEDFFAPLRGKNLACWCKIDEPCHADVLLELAIA